MDDEEMRVALARLLADPRTVLRMIDLLPDAAAVHLLKTWREVNFGPPPPAAAGQER